MLDKYIKQIYKTPTKNKELIFLDRDGTINKEEYLRNISQIKILESVPEGIRILNKKNISIIVITNQPSVAKGYITKQKLLKMNDKIFSDLFNYGAHIDCIFSCPHHPDGGIKKYSIKCECRKPGLLMFEEAIRIYSPKKIIGIIGDQTRDILAGNKLGIKTMLVNTGYSGKDGNFKNSPDIIADTFLSAVKKILNEKK